MTTEQVAAEVLAEHRLTTPVQCVCGWRETDSERDQPTWELHVASVLAARLDGGQACGYCGVPR